MMGCLRYGAKKIYYLSKLLCYPESNRCDDKIQMEVIDHGVGISEERFQKLGETFYSNNE